MTERFLDADEAQTVQFETFDATPRSNLTSAESMTDSLLSALNECSESSTVSIYRQEGTGKQSQIFLESFPPDKYGVDDLMMFIRNSYGSGNYRIMIRENGRIKANKLICVEMPKNLPVTTGGDDDMKQVLMMMQQQHQELIRSMQQMVVQQQPQQQSRKEMLEEMLQFKMLFGGDNNSGQSQGISEIVKTVNGLKTLGIDIGGIKTEEKEEEGFGSILEKMSPMIAALLTAKQAVPQQPVPQQQPQFYEKQAPPRPQPQQPQPQPQQEDDDVNLKIKMGLMMMLQGAKKCVKNDNVEFYADLVNEQFPEEKIHLLFAENAIDELIKISPSVAEYRDWFTEVLEHVKGMNGVQSKYSDDYIDGELTDNESDVISDENSLKTENSQDDKPNV